MLRTVKKKNVEKILVTGAAGFIGMHLCNSLLKDGYTVIGIDNINDYYDQKLKLDRLSVLDLHDNFQFKKIDLCNKSKLMFLTILSL